MTGHVALPVPVLSSQGGIQNSFAVDEGWELLLIVTYRNILLSSTLYAHALRDWITVQTNDIQPIKCRFKQGIVVLDAGFTPSDLDVSWRGETTQCPV